MKQITCSKLGGPDTCSEVITGNTPEEMIGNGWKHVQEKHPDLAQNISSNSQEVNDKWMADFKENTFPTLEEAQ